LPPEAFDFTVGSVVPVFPGPRARFGSFPSSSCAAILFRLARAAEPGERRMQGGRSHHRKLQDLLGTCSLRWAVGSVFPVRRTCSSQYEFRFRSLCVPRL
jgi:hypothetical protein